ncbi:MAG: hypothetical protein ABEI86_01540 [Halobacteriaceae archaeon]
MTTSDILSGKRIAELVATFSMGLTAVSVILTFLGLGLMAIPIQPQGNMLLTFGIVGGAVSLVLVAIASAYNRELMEIETDEEKPKNRDPRFQE